MPHGESWFTWVLRGTILEENLRRLVAALNGVVTEDHRSFLAHEEPAVGHLYGTLAVLVVLALLVRSAYLKVRDVQAALVPDERLTPRAFVELLVESVYGMMTDIMGAKAAREFLPLIGTCAFFILCSNAMGLIPGLTPPTDNLNTTLALAGIIFVATHVYGVRENGFNHIKHLFGPIQNVWALPLMLLMFVIEVISHFARPLSLSIRLMANMVADHLVVGAFLSIFAFLLPLPVMLLGTLVVLVQTLVFCVLSTVYIGLAIQHEDHH
jgi:F-type H+-transporting ATPase subunit a